MSDLDIIVVPDKAERAVAALGAIGYEIHEQASSESRRWYVELNRSEPSICSGPLQALRTSTVVPDMR